MPGAGGAEDQRKPTGEAGHGIGAEFFLGKETRGKNSQQVPKVSQNHC